jgi:N-acetylmuramoyl-L-alanine amidase
MTELANKHKSVQAYSIHCNAYNSITRGTEWLLSISTTKTHSDYRFCTQFLKDYCNMFSLPNRGIVQKKGSHGDYYYLHRKTPNNCKMKYIELFFGDNKNDCKKGQTKEYQDKATFFLASYILKRYGIQIQKPRNNTGIKYVVQAGVFSNRKNAEQLVENLKNKGFDSFIKIYK